MDWITREISTWAKELKTIIQDQIDTNLALTLTLTGISSELKVPPLSDLLMLIYLKKIKEPNIILIAAIIGILIKGF